MLPIKDCFAASSAKTRFEAGSVTKKRFMLELKTIQLLLGHKKYGVAASVRMYRVRGRDIFPAYGVTARLIVAVWLRLPDVPVKVNAVVDDGRYAAAVNVN
jgi:hypothetical protein